MELARVAIREVLRRDLVNHAWPYIFTRIYIHVKKLVDTTMRDWESVWMFESTLERLERGSFEVCKLDSDEYDTDNGKLCTH